MPKENGVLRPGEKAIRAVPADAMPRLSKWFTNRLGQHVEVTDFRRPSDGFSGDTFIATLQSIGLNGIQRNRVVVRADVRENIMIPLRDFTFLYRVQQSLYGAGVGPVPAVLHVEDDEGVLGTPFYVSEFVDGLAPGDSEPYTMLGWVPRSTPEQLRTMVFSGVEVLAKLHNIDWAGLGLSFLRRTTGGGSELEADFRYYLDCCDWAYGGRWSLVDQTALWLRAHWPRQERLKFSWGDARLGNMLWREHRPIAVLDWDWAAIGDPGRDVAYWLFSHYYFSEVLPGLPLSWPTRQEVVRHYELCSGDSLEDMTFYEGYACLRHLALMIRVAKLMKIAGTAPSDDFVENNPVVHCMRAIISQ